jgi:uncharacterized LabA/DUF88 family protein
MDRVAVFVDAGYLFAQGSAAITGSKKPRSQLVLSDAAVLQELRATTAARSGNLSLLRIYWYDGAQAYKGPTADHMQLASSDDVKLRLGFLNSQGQQKGVDSLIVTDLVDLARNRAICDALVLSGDEDIRVGVQIAQSFGVRVHLLGIAPSRGSQSPHLRQEADTLTEWDATTVAKFLALAPAAVAQEAAKPARPERKAKPAAAVVTEPPASISAVVKEFFTSLVPEQLESLREFQRSEKGVPHEYDGPLLAKARTALDRDLTTIERQDLRREFLNLVRATAPAAAAKP